MLLRASGPTHDRTYDLGAVTGVVDGDGRIPHGRLLVAFAEAVAAIIRGTCPQTPPGQQWYFGHPGEVQTIQIRR